MWGVWDAVDAVPIVGTAARGVASVEAYARGDEDAAKEHAQNFAFNAAGDAAGLMTGGSGKVAMVAGRAGAKVLVKHGATVATQKVIKVGKKGFKRNVKKNIKDLPGNIKKECKGQIEAIIEEEADVSRKMLEDVISEGLQVPLDELREMPKHELLDIVIQMTDQAIDEVLPGFNDQIAGIKIVGYYDHPQDQGYMSYDWQEDALYIMSGFKESSPWKLSQTDGFLSFWLQNKCDGDNVDKWIGGSNSKSYSTLQSADNYWDQVFRLVPYGGPSDRIKFGGGPLYMLVNRDTGAFFSYTGDNFINEFEEEKDAMVVMLEFEEEEEDGKKKKKKRSRRKGR